MSDEAAPTVKRGPGRPKSKPETTEDIGFKWKTKAKPNWDVADPSTVDTVDRLYIGRDEWPEGVALQWINKSVYGMEMPQRENGFYRAGWTPVHQEDFDGRFNGRFMLRDAPGQIVVDGSALVYTDIKIYNKLKQRDGRQAREQLDIKERALRGGDLPGVTLDAQHESALRKNTIGKSYERIDVPKD